METTTNFDRIAAAQKRGLWRDLLVAVTLVLGIAGGGLALESSARSLLAPTTTTTTSSMVAPETTEELAQAPIEGDAECFVAFGEIC